PGIVGRVPKHGGPVTELAAHVGHPVAIALDDAYVYWTDEDSGTIGRIAKGGGAPQTVATTSIGAWPLAVDGERVYWAIYGSSGYVAAAPKSGGAEVILAAELDQPFSIA